MTAQELEIIRADLAMAKMVLYPANENDKMFENPNMMNLAEYHSAQALEKCLKGIVRDGGKLDDELAKSHSIEGLMLKAELCRPNIIQEYKFAAENAETLSKANGLRYGIKSVEAKDVYATYKEAKALFYVLEKEHLKENNISKEDHFKEAREQYNNTRKLNFNSPNRQTNHHYTKQENNKQDNSRKHNSHKSVERD
jgi:HEPN domain-containing protein